MPGQQDSRRQYLLILALGAVLRVLWLMKTSLWSDEAVTLAIAGAPAGQVSALVNTLETTPALHFLLMHFWVKPWGDPLLGMRVFSVLCGLATLPLFWSLCRRLVPEQAPLAFFLGAVSSLWIHAAQSGRCYAFYLLLASAQALLALRLRRAWSARDGLAYAAVAACGLATHYHYHFFVFGLAFGGLLEKKLRQGWLGRWILVHAAAGLCFLPLLPAALAQRSLFLPAWAQTESFSAVMALRLLGAFLLDAAYLGLAVPNAAAAAGAAALVLMATGLWRLRRRLSSVEAETVRFCLAGAVVPIVIGAALELANGRPVFQARFLVYQGLFLYPLLALAAEKGFPALWSRAARLALAVLVSGGACAYFASNLIFDPRLAALAAFIRRTGSERAPVVHWGALEYAAMRYYYLPERRHYLLDLTPGDARYARLPGYPGLIKPEELSRFPPAVVIDPERRAFPHRVGFSSGPGLLALVRRGS